MASLSAFLSKDASAIFPFDGYGMNGRSDEESLITAMNGLRCGEILRLFIDQNPLQMIRRLVMTYGSRLIFQYLQNRDGAVIIDFKIIRE